ncbi:MAG: Rab family GTPase [Candidatus Thorarchaeota archaeon]
MSLTPTRDRQFKTVLIGDTAVGKTSIRRNFMGQSFTSSHIATLGVDFAQKLVAHENADIRLVIWDLAGEHSYENVRRGYYSGAHGIIFVYSVIDKKTFDNSQLWFIELKKYIRDLPPVAIIGNKVDLRSSADPSLVVTTKEGKKFAQRFSEKMKVPVSFWETSAKTGENIDNLFEELITNMILVNP